MSDRVSIVEIEGVSASTTEPGRVPLQDVSLMLEPSDCMLVTRESYVEHASLCDVAQGLRIPEAGVVRFEGQDWRHMGLHEAAAARGRIGRVFDQFGWISNLDMFENIGLVPRHHSTRSDADIRTDIDTLCERAGLSALLSRRPHMLSRDESSRAQWVRAFLGEPRLLLLEAPLRDAGPYGEVLASLVAEARARGAAVLWIQSRQDTHGVSAVPPDARRATLANGRLVPDDV